MICSAAALADTIGGASLALRSSGAAAGTGWMLTQDGYVGTYVQLSQPTALNVSALAAGTASNGVSPQMTFVVANSRKSFTVSPAATSTYGYTTPTLAAGTYVVRAQLDNQTASATPTLGISSVNISGAGVTVDNTNSDANALAAATTYATNYRSGAAKVTLVDQNGSPLPAGVATHIELVRNAFNFAVAVSGQSPNSSNATWLDYDVTNGRYTPPAAGTPQATYQQAILQNFNTIVPANAGKWQNNEFTPGSLQMQLVDAMTQFAVQNKLAIRMHNLIWDTQQPTWEDANCVAATADPTNALRTRETINSAITSRIGYYIGQPNLPLGSPRGSNYLEMDVLNEPVHGMGAGKTDPYQTLLGASGIANVYQQVQTAEANVGRNTLLCTNEYNVVNTSSDPSSPTGAADPYANWFLREILLLNNAGSGHVVTGTGSECYTFYSADAPSLSAATMTQAMQNLSVAGNPFVLTEFGISGTTPVTPSATTFAADLKTALTVTYGNPDAVTFGFWGGLGGVDAASPTSLYDASWAITPVGLAYRQWLAQYQTSLNLTTDSAGALNFIGTYGTYRLTVDGQNYTFAIAPGATSVTVTKPTPVDLAVTGLTASDATPGVGDSVTLTATVANNSASTTARNEAVTFADGGVAIGTATIASLAPGASATASFTWVPGGGGSHNLTATAAPLPGETNTANNTAGLSLTVYNYYTYTTSAGFAGKGRANGVTEVDNWYRFNIGVPMSMVKQVRVTVPVSTYDPSGSRAVGAPDPYLQSYTGDGTTDLASVGTVTPTGQGSWVMSSQDPAVTATVKPLADNYLDLWIKGLNKTASVRDTVVTQGLTIQIKYLAP